MALSGTPVTEANMPPSLTLLTNCSAVAPRTVFATTSTGSTGSESSLIVESECLIRRYVLGGVQLPLQDASDDGSSPVFGRAHCRAANTANGPRNQDRLARLYATGDGYQLASCRGHQR